MNETIETGAGEPAQPVSETHATIAVSVEDAAAHFGISPQAVRKRIAAGHLDAERAGRSWRVYIPAQPNETETPERFRETSKPPDTKPVAQSQRDQFALMVEPIVAPWVAKVEELSREAERNRLRAEDAESRLATTEQRLAAAEQERDDLQRQADDLRGRASLDQSERVSGSPQTAQDAPGQTNAETLSNESNEAPASERRGGFAGWWDRITGR